MSATSAPENARADAILREVLRYFKLPLGILRSSAKHAPIAYQRQVVMYMLRESGGGLSFPTIGRMVGRDHTTVIHDCDRIADALAGKVKDANLIEQATRDVTAIRQRVQSGAEQMAMPVPGKVDPMVRAIRDELRVMVPRLQHFLELLENKIDAAENPRENSARGLLVGDAKGGVAK